jgi:ABC-type transport system involved in multi-copper enzyme maturation permease subunit
MVTQSVSTRSAARSYPWNHWRRQVLAIVRLELRKSFGRRAIGLYFLGLLPVALPILLWVSVQIRGSRGEVADLASWYAKLFQGFNLHFVIFLGCVTVFGSLMRREVLDRTLHYYFLTPVRRELVVVAKYLTGLVVTVIVFGLSTFTTFVLTYLAQPSDQGFLLRGPGIGHLAAYLLVTVLACVGYGAMFLVFSFFFRSPIVPALMLFGWEWLHPFLPPVLKQLSIIHYLQPLCPVPIPEGPLAILSDAPSPWLAIPGLLLLSALLVAISAWRARKMEISYEED